MQISHNNEAGCFTPRGQSATSSDTQFSNVVLLRSRRSRRAIVSVFISAAIADVIDIVWNHASPMANRTAAISAERLHDSDARTRCASYTQSCISEFCEAAMGLGSRAAFVPTASRAAARGIDCARAQRSSNGRRFVR